MKATCGSKGHSYLHTFRRRICCFVSSVNLIEFHRLTIYKQSGRRANWTYSGLSCCTLIVMVSDFVLQHKEEKSICHLYKWQWRRISLAAARPSSPARTLLVATCSLCSLPFTCWLVLPYFLPWRDRQSYRPTSSGKRGWGTLVMSITLLMKTWKLCCSTMRRQELQVSGQNQAEPSGTSQALSTLWEL